MTPGYRTQAMIRRARRDHAPKDWLRQAQDDERRAVEMLGWLLTIVAAALVGTAAVLIADQLTGLQYVAELIRVARGVE